MVKYEHTYEATPAMIAVPFAKSFSSPASISMLRTQVKISTASSLDPTIEDVETIISESPTDLTEDDIIREGTNEDEESRESAPEDADEEEKEEEDEKEDEEEEDEKEEEHHDNENEEDESESQESHEFVPHRVDGHTYHEAAMLGLDGTPTAPNANNKKKKKDGTSSMKRNKSKNGGGGSMRGSLRSLKREDSMNKEIKKPTSQAAARAADDNRTAAASTAPPSNTIVASAPRDEEGFVPHRADGGLDGTPTAGRASKDTTGKKKSMKLPSFFRKKK